MNHKTEHLHYGRDRKRLNYIIKVEEDIDPDWQNWFDGMAISTNSTNTMVSGPVDDQPELFGVLNKIRDLNLTLVSVNRLSNESDQE